MNHIVFLLSARETVGVECLEETLKGIIADRFKAEASEGKTVISTSEAGGSVTFQLSGSLSPQDVIVLAATAIGELKANPRWLDENWYPRMNIQRMRASFAKAFAS